MRPNDAAMTYDIESLIKLASTIAAINDDGHLTIMRFTTGWKVIKDTPELTTKGWQTIHDVQIYPELEDALKEYILDLAKR